MPEQNKNYHDYFKHSYLTEERWCDYWYQVKEIMQAGQRLKVLEIGPGNKIVTSVLRHLGYDVTTLDREESVEPDIVADVLSIPVAGNSFDVILIAEVLEHLPYDKFIDALTEIKRVTKKRVILSIPHWGRHFSLEFRIPGLGVKRFQFKGHIFSKKHRDQGEHFWEIGKKGYALRKVKQDIVSTGFILEDDYIAFSSPYHHFFVLNK